MRDWIESLAGGATAERAERYLKELVPPALLAAVVGMMAFWSLPPIRLATLEVAARVAPSVAPRALEDSDPQIRRRACAHLLESDWPAHTKQLRGFLYRSPPTATACLTRTHDGETSTDESKFAAKPELLAWGLSKQWTLDLLGSTEPGRYVECEAVDAIGKIDGLRGTPAAAHLVLVAGLAQREETRSCAADAVSPTLFADENVLKAPFLKKQFRRQLPRLIRSAFPTRRNASPSDESPEKSEVKLPEALPAADYRAWLVRRSCSIVREPDEHATVVRAFRPLFDRSDREVPSTYFSPGTWRRACDRFDELAAEEWSDTPAQTFVEKLHAAAIETATDLASRDVHVATRKDQGDKIESTVPPTVSTPRRGDEVAPTWIRRKRRQRAVDTPVADRLVDGLMP